MIVLKFCFVLFSLLVIINTSHLAQSRFADEHTNEKYGTGSNLILNFYQNVLSPIKSGNSCAMYPSCSQYSKILFETLSFHEAYILTFDRLLRCGHELYFYPEINSDGHIRWYDSPLRNNNIPELNSDTSSTNDSTKISNQLTLNSTLDDRFANYLLNSGEYYRASTEFLRLWFYDKDTLKSPVFLHKSGLCLFRGAMYNDYINFANKYKEQLYRNPAIKAEVNFYIGKSFYQLKDYPKAITTLSWSGLTFGDSLYSELNYYIGLSYARIFDWQSSIKYMNKISKENQNAPAALRLKSFMLTANDLPVCKPWLAGLSSAIIPGSGYLYAHRPGTAITSFIVNSLLIYSFYEAIRHESYGLAATIGFFGSGWYLGNIYGSSKAARDYNSYIRNEYINNILNDKK